MLVFQAGKAARNTFTKMQCFEKAPEASASHKANSSSSHSQSDALDWRFRLELASALLRSNVSPDHQARRVAADLFSTDVQS
jgi:hypothetical protein